MPQRRIPNSLGLTHANIRAWQLWKQIQSLSQESFQRRYSMFDSQQLSGQFQVLSSPVCLIIMDWIIAKLLYLQCRNPIILWVTVPATFPVDGAPPSHHHGHDWELCSCNSQSSWMMLTYDYNVLCIIVLICCNVDDCAWCAWWCESYTYFSPYCVQTAYCSTYQATYAATYIHTYTAYSITHIL